MFSWTRWKLRRQIDKERRNLFARQELIEEEILLIWEVVRELQALESQQRSLTGQLESQQAKLANDLRELRHKSKPGQ